MCDIDAFSHLVQRGESHLVEQKNLDTRILRESKQGQPLARNQVMIDPDEYERAINLLQRDEIDQLAIEVLERKVRYLQEMYTALEAMKDDPLLRDLSRREIKESFSDWFKAKKRYFSRGAKKFSIGPILIIEICRMFA